MNPLQMLEEPLPPGVYLVGAGPGRMDLLTLRAVRCLKQADCVLYDQLVQGDIVALANKAEKVAAGKKKSAHTLTQDEIGRRLVEEGRKGKVVVRLKGGDPNIFGRLSEEIKALQEAGLPFEVVPGITSASAVAASLSFPLTDRFHASTLIYTTGHNSKTGTVPELNWELLVQKKQAVVIYMGLSNLQVICQTLLERGIDPLTPVLVVSNGARDNQQAVGGCVNDIYSRVNAAGLPFPAIVYIGSFVGDAVDGL